MDPAVVEAVGARWASRSARAGPIGGGDSSDAWRVELADDTVVFAKTDPDGIAGPVHVRGRRTAPAGGHRRGARPRRCWPPSARRPTPDASLHRARRGSNPAGPTATTTTSWAARWPTLHRTTRAPVRPRPRQPPRAPTPDQHLVRHLGRALRPATAWPRSPALAADAGVLSDDTVARVDRLIDRLPELVGPPEPPALVHGDLWAGNALVDSDGRPWLIDPAVSYSHREIDLAMMRLFGGFGPAVFAAYDEAFPLADGWADRVELLPALLPAAAHPAPVARRATSAPSTTSLRHYT